MERRELFGGGIAAFGLFLVIVQFVQGLQQVDRFEGTDSAIIFTFETVPFVLVGLSLIVMGYWLTDQERYEPDLPRLVAWKAGSIVLFASVGALLLFSLVVTVGLEVRAEAAFVTMNMITIGAVVGALVGMYDAQSRARQRDLEAERDRVEMFAQKSADVNNYGRELNKSESIDEVSSLCIQAMQTFLGLTELAFAVTDETETELVDNTAVGISDEALAELSQDALEGQQATVIERESPPPEIAEKAESVFTILVTTHEDSSVVLLALTNERTSFDEEDIQLLEMLVAHAATALDRIYESVLDGETPSTT